MGGGGVGGGLIGTNKGIIAVKMDLFIHIPAIFSSSCPNFNFRNFYFVLHMLKTGIYACIGAL